MVDENDASDMVKEFDKFHAPQSTDDSESRSTPTRKRTAQNEGRNVNYFSMKEEDIEKEKNKIREEAHDLFKDLDKKDKPKNTKKDDTTGWGDDGNGWGDDGFDEELDIHI